MELIIKSKYNVVQNNPDNGWLWWDISKNFIITYDIIKNNPDKKWSWYSITCNTMKKGRKTSISNYRLKIIKTLQIQRHWRNCVSNPEYKLAQKLIKDTLNK